MSNIDKRALREAAEKAISEEGETWWNEHQLASDYGLALHRTDAKFIVASSPATVLALLDELEAKDQRVAELEAREVKLNDINEYLAEVHDKTLNRAFRLLAEGVRAGDVASIRAAGINIAAAGKGE